MKVQKETNKAIAQITAYLNKGLSIGLVPTMGALHDGHLSLIKQSKNDNDITVVSIFVNPIQFNNSDDFEKYPSSQDRDLKLLEKTECDMVFMPDQQEMYPSSPKIRFDFGHLENTMEGLHRPGHFSGVAIVVLKLFHILSPTYAYFGQKDLQQFKIIQQMVMDTSLNVELKMMPIVRNDAGLALSSRNQRLSPGGLKNASQINMALKIAGDEIAINRQAKDIIAKGITHLSKFKEIEIEYFELVKLKDLSPVNTITEAKQLVLCFAGYIEGVRLIDNLIIE